MSENVTEARLTEMIGHFTALVTRGFTALDVRLETLDARLDRLEGRLDRLEARIDRLDARFDKLDPARPSKRAA